MLIEVKKTKEIECHPTNLIRTQIKHMSFSWTKLFTDMVYKHNGRKTSNSFLHVLKILDARY